MTTIHLLTGYNSFYGQSRKPWVSIDTGAFVGQLRARDIEVVQADWHDLALGKFRPVNSTIVYSFSQLEHIRAWLKDQLSILAIQNRLIPSLPLLYCHENKGFAQLFLESMGIRAPRAWYICSAEDIPDELPYPIVLKKIYGSNGKGVFLCANRAQLKAKIARLNLSLSMWVRLDHQRRRHLRKGRIYEGYPDFEPRRDADDWLFYMREGGQFLLQEYIPGLNCDYRVIATPSRSYLMRRFTNEGDFRASGTKKFDFDLQPPEGMLDFARAIYERMDNPYLSMDVGYQDGVCHLFEFQASHFGTAAIVRSRGYYALEDGAWRYKEEKSNLETVLAEGLSLYLTREKS